MDYLVRCPRTSLFLGALAYRLAALGVAMRIRLFPEYWEYDTIARNLLAGRGYVYEHLGLSYRAYAEPLYTFVTAAVYGLTGKSDLALVLAQAVASAALCVVIFELARRIFDERSALTAGALVALHPGLAGYAVKFHPLAFDALLISLVALALLALASRPSLSSQLGFGVALGLCVLSRPTIAFFVPAAVVWLAVSEARRRALPRFAAGLLVAALVVAPWPARNYARLGAFVLTRTTDSYVLWLGNNASTTGGASDPSDPRGYTSLYHRAPQELRERVVAADEVGRRRIFLHEALDFVQADPRGAAIRVAQRLGYFWWFPPYFGKRYPAWQLVLYGGYYLVLLALAAAGLARAARSPHPAVRAGALLVVFLLVSVSVGQALFYVEGRHRLAIEPLLAVLSGGLRAARGSLTRGATRRRWPPRAHRPIDSWRRRKWTRSQGSPK